MKNKYYKIKLVKHGGCKGCTKNCLYNSPCATPEVAKRTARIKLPCNNSKEK